MQIVVFTGLLAAAAPADTPKPMNAEDLSTDLKKLSAYSTALEGMLGEMNRLRKTIKGTKRGHYTSDEHDKIESLLFRYLCLRESLWGIVDRYRDYKENFGENENQTKAFVLAFNAALHLAYYSSALVQTFMDEPAVIDKLNERYHRSDIPRGTYDKIFRSLTNVDNVQALKAAWVLYEEEVKYDESMVRKLVRKDPAYRELITQNLQLYRKAEKQINDILEKNSLLLPGVRNKLRHSAITTFALKSKDTIGDSLYTIRGILFVNVSRIRAPKSANLKLTKKQLEEVKAMMKPGDIVLTFSSGYMSNIFLPGMFKHGITYVGVPGDRKVLGKTAPPKGTPGPKVTKMKKDMTVEKLPSGEEADLIEAVAEGVIFNSLSCITDEHINRMLVLRPNLSEKEVAQALNTVFLLLGNTYDFHFDFGDGTHHCCTEVIYRALHEQGAVKFELTSRMGIPTLSADDIIDGFLKAESGAKPFDFVLLAERDDSAKGAAAVVHTGQKGLERLRKLMAAAE
ncbi:hypothetical protein ACFLQU_04590 [Verrucomicrobiota bacterium]